MEDKAIRGVPWTMLSYALNKVLTLATTVALARLLTPEDFGLVAYAYLAIVLLAVFRDFGVGSALIVRDPLDDRDKATTFAIILICGVAGSALISALSSPVANLLGEPEMAGILAALSLTLVFGAPAWFYEAVMQRELEFRKRFLGMTAYNVVFAPVAVVLAVAGAGVWSLVVGNIAGTIASAAVYTILAPYRTWPGFDLARARAAIAGGAGFMVQGGMAFIRQNADYLAVGRILGTVELGYYSLAYRLSEVPYLGIADPIAKVVFPGFSRMRSRGEDVSESFLSVLRLVAVVTCPIGVILSGAADPFVNVVLGDKWLPMIGPLSVLGLWCVLRSVTAITGWLLNSLQMAGLLGAISVAILIPLVPGVILAADLGGMTAVAWVVLADTAIEMVAISVLVQRRASISIGRQWAAVRPVVLACVPTWATAALVARATADSAPVVSLGASVLSAVAVYLLTLFALEPGLPRQVVGQIGRTVRRAPAMADAP
jgi:lipopolysaccharide exporter